MAFAGVPLDSPLYQMFKTCIWVEDFPEIKEFRQFPFPNATFLGAPGRVKSR